MQRKMLLPEEPLADRGHPGQPGLSRDRTASCYGDARAPKRLGDADRATWEWSHQAMAASDVQNDANNVCVPQTATPSPKRHLNFGMHFTSELCKPSEAS